LGRSQSNAKTILLATRVTPRINDLIKQMAYREGLHVSEWIRNIIVNELKKNGLLHTKVMKPTYPGDERPMLLQNQAYYDYEEIDGSRPG